MCVGGNWAGGPGVNEVPSLLGVGELGSVGYTEWERGSSFARGGLQAGVGTASDLHQSLP